MKFAVGLLVAGTLASCNGPTGPLSTGTPGVSPLAEAPHIELGTLDQLFDAAGPYLLNAGDVDVIGFRCTVVEGAFCWFGERNQDGPVPGDLARTLIDQIGPRVIENGNRNEVYIQCYHPTNGANAYCEIDWGWGAGWEALALK